MTALKASPPQARRYERNLSPTASSTAKPENYTADIMTAANAVTIEALKLTGVSKADIDRLFLQTPEFSAFRLSRCQELDWKIRGVKRARKVKRK
jgi:hypothetical protein